MQTTLAILYSYQPTRDTQTSRASIHVTMHPQGIELHTQRAAGNRFETPPSGDEQKRLIILSRSPKYAVLFIHEAFVPNSLVTVSSEISATKGAMCQSQPQ